MTSRGRPLMLLLLMAIIGCRAAAVAPEVAAPALPTSATAGGSTIVAIAPPAQQCCPKQTLPQFLGLTGLLKGVGGLLDRLRNRLGSRFPGLEAKPEVLAISDPANLDSPNPAVAAAAGVKADEDAAAQKVKAIRYLGTIGCGGCYPDVQDALLAALDDCTEAVRYEAVVALRATSSEPCKKCREAACCSTKVRDRLEKLVNNKNSNNCYEEPSDRVRRVARLVLNNCSMEPRDPAPPGLPQEGPAEEIAQAKSVLVTGIRTNRPGEPTPAAPPAPTPAVPVSAPIQQQPTPARPPAAVRIEAQPSMTAAAYPVAVATATSQPTQPIFASRADGSQPIGYQVRWEHLTAPFHEFRSQGDAWSVVALIRTQAMTATTGTTLQTPRQMRVARQDWTDPSRLESKFFAHALTTTPAGGVSGIWEEAGALHFVRVLDRQPLPTTMPATAITPVAAPELRSALPGDVVDPALYRGNSVYPRATLPPPAACDCQR